MNDPIENGGVAMLPVKPELDLEVQGLHEEAVKLKEYAEARVITSNQDMVDSTNDMSMIVNLKKALEERRKGYVKPLNDHVKGINEAFKSIMEPIEAADKITRGKMLAYQNAQEAKRAEEEKINRLRVEAAEAEMRLKGELTAPVDMITVTPEAPKTVHGEAGDVGRRMVRKWDLVDLSQIPIDYLILDTVKINKVVKAGIPSIPGIRIYEEAVLTVRTAKLQPGDAAAPEELPLFGGD